MINLYFKKKVNDIDVGMEVSAASKCEIKSSAEIESNRAYNLSVTNQIKEDLFEKYSITERMHLSMRMSFYREHELVDFIIKDMADSLGLLKEVKDDK